MDDAVFTEKLLKLSGSREYMYDSSTGRFYTYDDVWKHAYAYAEGLKKSGSSGFAAVLENSAELFILYHAAMLANMTMVPIDPHKSEGEIESILKENAGKTVIRKPEDIPEDTQEVSAEDIARAINSIDYDRDYIVTYTSGSTGFPKGVRHKLRSLFLTAESFGNAVGLDETRTMCHVMPMTYMAGILNTILMPLIRGSRTVIMPRFDVMSAIRFWKTVEKYGADSFWLSPTMLNILMTVDRKGDGKKYLSSIDPLFFIGTAPLFETLRNRFESTYEVKLLQSYGLSETLFLSTEVPGKESPASAVGFLLPEVDLKLSDDGEIMIDVPWMFKGYTNDDTDAYFLGSYYLTGDMGRSEEGILSITGRIKDLIIKGGMNISPKQIEDCMLKSCGVDECAVSGVTIDDEERVVCWYVCSDEKDEGAMNRIIEKELGKHCCADRFERVSSIPKNINGKPDKKKLVQEYSC